MLSIAGVRFNGLYEHEKMSDHRQRNVSLDFVSSQLARLLTEFADIKQTADLDRRNARAHYDNLAASVTRTIGAMDAKLEMGLAEVHERIDSLEESLNKRFDM